MAASMILEAIATRKCLAATYNHTPLKLAPHVFYTKHDELFVDAVTIEREGKPPKEIKLGTFKVTGLKSPALIDESFAPQAFFNPADEKYSGVTLFVVEK